MWFCDVILLDFFVMMIEWVSFLFGYLNEDNYFENKRFSRDNK